MISKVVGCDAVVSEEAFKKYNGDIIIAIDSILALKTDNDDSETLLKALNITQKNVCTILLDYINT